jgi:3-hydroxypropanoate dehydrogenase
MITKLDELALDRLFRTARTRNGWTDRPVTENRLRELYDLLKFGPTSVNCPARFVWVRSAEGKEKLAALAAPGNAEKILTAPITVIIGIGSKPLLAQPATDVRGSWTPCLTAAALPAGPCSTRQAHRTTK